MGLSKTCVAREKTGVYCINAEFLYQGQTLSPDIRPLGIFWLNDLVAPPDFGGVPFCQNTFDVWPDQPVAEVWYSNRDVTYLKKDQLLIACDGETLMGVISVADASGDLEYLAHTAYEQIFDVIHELGYPVLFRMWNYFPAINQPDDRGLERYRAFCKGRADAFFASRHSEESYLPAGTGIGSRSGPMTITFMASRSDNRVNFENPRQMPAYHYPQNYGPRSPSFARGTFTFRHGGGEFYVSGTASIVGHETVHVDCLQSQVDTAFENIALLLAEENLVHHGANRGFTTFDLDQVRIYVRHPQQAESILAACRKHLNPRAEIVCLGADICRSPLLVEIEGVVFLTGNQVRTMRNPTC